MGVHIYKSSSRFSAGCPAICETGRYYLFLLTDHGIVQVIILAFHMNIPPMTESHIILILIMK